MGRKPEKSQPMRMAKKFLDQRIHRRKHCGVPIDGRPGSCFDQTRAVDISWGGLGLISQKKIPLKKKIAVEIEVGPEDDSVVMMGEVKWVCKIKDSSYYRVGMEFLKDQLALEYHA